MTVALAICLIFLATVAEQERYNRNLRKFRAWERKGMVEAQVAATKFWTETWPAMQRIRFRKPSVLAQIIDQEEQG